jgi:PAS domain S-box-containing protein
MKQPAILVVEDNPITLEMIQVALESEGYTVLLAGDGHTALLWAEEQRPDLVLQDLLLPDMDGFELVQRLRALPGGAEIPILAFSGYLSKMEQARSQQVGFTDYLFKPVEPSRLVQIIRAYLPPAAELRDTAGQGRHVLVVHDDPVQLRLLHVHLQRAGFRVTTASNGVEALAQAKQGPPEAILSDVLMPGLDGFRLSLAVRLHPDLGHIPVVLISAAYTEEADQRLARTAGASALLTSTPDGKEVIEALLASFSQPRPQPEHIAELTEEYTYRLIRQLERQVSLGASLSERLALREAELSMLAGMAHTFETTTQVQPVLEELLYRSLDVAGVSKGVVYFLEADGSLRPRAQIGYTNATEELDQFFGHREVLRQALENGEPMEVPNSRLPPEAARDLLEKTGAKSLLIAPLIFGQERLGLLVMGSVKRELGEDWIPFARALGSQIGQSLRLARTLSLLQEKEERLTRIVDTMTDGLLICDRQGRLTFANVAAERILGLPAAEITARSCDDPAWRATTVNGRPVPAEEYPMAEVLRSGQAVSEVELAVERPDGKWAVVSVSAAPLRNAHGALAGAVLSLRDITDRKQAEQALSARARQQATVAELGQLALLEKDLSKLMEEAVAGLARTLEVEYAKVLELLPDGKALLLRAGVGWKPGLVGRATIDAAAGSQAGYTLRCREPVIVEDLTRETRFDGPPLLREHAVISGMSVIIHGQGRPFGVLGAHTTRPRPFTRNDVHFLQAVANVLAVAIQRKTSEDALARQSQELAAYTAELEQFAYVAAHDLQEPLRTVASFTQLLAQRYQGRLDAQADKFIQMAVQGADRMRRLIDDLLAYSRVARGPSRFELVDCEAAFRRSLDALGGMVAESGAEVTCDPLPTLSADEVRLEQLFRNLLSNAIKFRGPRPPRIHAWAEQRGSEWVFAVRDNGIGIDPRHAEQIFQIFERLHSKQEYPGTGIGLAICKRIVERHGGRIWVESESGQGATFRFALPERRVAA